MTIAPAAPAEGAQVQGGYHVQHHEHKIVFGQPLAHAHRHQQRLITLRNQKVLRTRAGPTLTPASTNRVPAPRDG
jgi:hypothetical protein